jgi:hypothetical protein
MPTYAWARFPLKLHGWTAPREFFAIRERVRENKGAVGAVSSMWRDTRSGSLSPTGRATLRSCGVTTTSTPPCPNAGRTAFSVRPRCGRRCSSAARSWASRAANPAPHRRKLGRSAQEQAFDRQHPQLANCNFAEVASRAARRRSNRQLAHGKIPSRVAQPSFNFGFRFHYRHCPMTRLRFLLPGTFAMAVRPLKNLPFSLAKPE